MHRQLFIKNILFLVVLSLVCSIAFSNSVPSYAVVEPECDVTIRGPFTKKYTGIVLKVSVEDSIIEDDWIILFLPSTYPIPDYSEKRDETGRVTTTRDWMLGKIDVNFLPLDPFKTLPVLNYAENSIAFPMPRTLEVKDNEKAYLFISITMYSSSKEGKGSFGIWHKSFSHTKYSEIIEITKQPTTINDFSVAVENSVCNEVSDWDITFTHSYPWIIYKNQCTVSLSFNEKLKIPASIVNSRITVNGIPIYETKISDKYLSIVLPITIYPNDKVHIHIPKFFGLGLGEEFGIYDYEAKVLISSVLYNGLKGNGSFQVYPGKPYITSSSDIVDTQTQYTLKWYCDQEENQEDSVEIRWPNNYQIEEGSEIYYKWGHSYARSKKTPIKDGTLSVPFPDDMPKNGRYELTFSEYSPDRSSKKFINPSLTSLQFSFRYPSQEEWTLFTPLVLKPNGFHIKYASIDSLVVSDNFEFECSLHSQELFHHLTDGFVVHLPSNYQLPLEFPGKSIFISGTGSTIYPEVQIVGTSILVKTPTDELNRRYADKTECRFKISSTAGIFNPHQIGSEVKIGIETKATNFTDWTGSWILLEQQKTSSVNIIQGLMGENEWYVKPPFIHFETDEVGFVVLNRYFVQLPIDDIPLLEGQHITYFRLSDEATPDSSQFSKNFLVKVDTKTICCEILQPRKEWQIVTNIPYVVKGKVEIPITVDRYNFLKLIDQSIQIQGRACVVQPDGIFQAEIPLQNGKNEIPITITDWAGHTQTIIRHVYHGKGVEVQIGSKTAQVNGREVTLSTHPVIVKNRVFVPLRFLAESFGANVQYKGDLNPARIQIKKDNQLIELIMGSTTTFIDGKEITLEEAPFIQENSSMIPMYFLLDLWNMEAIWEAVERRVIILFPTTPHHSTTMYLM